MAIFNFFYTVSVLALSCSWNAQALSNNRIRSTSTATARGSPLYHAPAPKHDVSGGRNAMDELTQDQKDRVNAFVIHQDGVPKIGFPADVRSLVQYNHGFAVMSTNLSLIHI